MNINCNGAYIDADDGMVWIATFNEHGRITRPYFCIDEYGFEIINWSEY